MADPDTLGKVVRWAWVAWAREQPDVKPSWLLGWEELDEGQREVDRRIGRAVADAARALDRTDRLASALARERRRTAEMRRAIALALNGPSDAEVGMETARSRLAHVERTLYAALADDAPGRPGEEGEGR